MANEFDVPAYDPLAGDAADGGARPRDELGAVKVSRIADLALYRIDRILFVPLNNPVRQLVYGETGAGLEMALVDGEVVMKGGRLTRIDEAAVLDEINEEQRKLKPLLMEAEQHVDRMLDPYRRIMDRCRVEGIAADTYPTLLPG